MDTQALLNFDATAREWLRAVAESFGLPASTFKALLGVAEDEVPASRIEAIQYTLPGGCHTSCREHIDRGLLTLIYSDCGQGLQVWVLASCNVLCNFKVCLMLTKLC